MLYVNMFVQENVRTELSNSIYLLLARSGLIWYHIVISVLLVPLLSFVFPMFCSFLSLALAI